ncbi:unnamed protein product, partial [Phaeothamnion confervicola]
DATGGGAADARRTRRSLVGPIRHWHAAAAAATRRQEEQRCTVRRFRLQQVGRAAVAAWRGAAAARSGRQSAVTALLAARSSKVLHGAVAAWRRRASGHKASAAAVAVAAGRFKEATLVGAVAVWQRRHDMARRWHSVRAINDAARQRRSFVAWRASFDRCQHRKMAAAVLQRCWRAVIEARRQRHRAQALSAGVAAAAALRNRFWKRGALAILAASADLQQRRQDAVTRQVKVAAMRQWTRAVAAARVTARAMADAMAQRQWATLETWMSRVEEQRQAAAAAARAAAHRRLRALAEWRRWVHLRASARKLEAEMAGRRTAAVAAAALAAWRRRSAAAMKRASTVDTALTAAAARACVRGLMAWRMRAGGRGSAVEAIKAPARRRSTSPQQQQHEQQQRRQRQPWSEQEEERWSPQMARERAGATPVPSTPSTVFGDGAIVAVSAPPLQPQLEPARPPHRRRDYSPPPPPPYRHGRRQQEREWTPPTPRRPSSPPPPGPLPPRRQQPSPAVAPPPSWPSLRPLHPVDAHGDRGQMKAAAFWRRRRLASAAWAWRNRFVRRRRAALTLWRYQCADADGFSRLWGAHIAIVRLVESARERAKARASMQAAGAQRAAATEAIAVWRRHATARRASRQATCDGWGNFLAGGATEALAAWAAFAVRRKGVRVAVAGAERHRMDLLLKRAVALWMDSGMARR